MSVPENPAHPFNHPSYWEKVTVYSNVTRGSKGTHTSTGDRDPIWDRPSSEIDMTRSVEATKAHIATMRTPTSDRRLLSGTNYYSEHNINVHLCLLQAHLQNIQHLRLQLPCKSSFLVLFNHAGALPNLKTIEFHVQQSAPVLDNMDRLMDLATSFFKRQLCPTAATAASSDDEHTPPTIPRIESLVLNDTKALESGRQVLVVPMLKCLTAFTVPTPKDTIPHEGALLSTSSPDQISHTGLINLEIRNHCLESKDQRLFWEACARIPGRLGLFGVSNLGGRTGFCPEDVTLSRLTELEMTALDNITSSEQILLLKKCPRLKTLIWKAYNMDLSRKPPTRKATYVYGAKPRQDTTSRVKKSPTPVPSLPALIPKPGTKRHVEDPLWTSSDNEHEDAGRLALQLETLVLDGDMFLERDCKMLIGSIAKSRLKRLTIVNMTGSGSLDFGPLNGGHQLESLVELDFSKCLMVTSPMIQRFLESCPRLEVLRARELLVADVIEAVSWASKKSAMAMADTMDDVTSPAIAAVVPSKRPADEIMDQDAEEVVVESRIEMFGRQVHRRTGLWLCGKIRELSLQLILDSQKEAAERRFILGRLKILPQLQRESLQMVVRDYLLKVPKYAQRGGSRDAPVVSLESSMKNAFEIASLKRSAKNLALKRSSSKTLSSKRSSSKRSSSKDPSASSSKVSSKRIAKGVKKGTNTARSSK